MSFSKTYTSTTSNQSVFLTWEAGFDNLKMYHDRSIVLKVDTGKEIRNGVIREIDGLGKVELYLPNTSHIIHLSINNETYTEERSPASQVNLSGVSYMFWILTTLATLGSLITLSRFGFNLSYPIVIIELVVDIIAVSSYLLAAIFAGKNKVWGYFLGGGIFILMTLLAFIGNYSLGFSAGTIVHFIIRLAIIGYLISEFKKVRVLMSSSNASEHNNSDLLDI